MTSTLTKTKTKIADLMAAMKPEEVPECWLQSSNDEDEDEVGGERTLKPRMKMSEYPTSLGRLSKSPRFQSHVDLPNAEDNMEDEVFLTTTEAYINLDVQYSQSFFVNSIYTHNDVCHLSYVYAGYPLLPFF
jgi:hypothetical protein